MQQLFFPWKSPLSFRSLNQVLHRRKRTQRLLNLIGVCRQLHDQCPRIAQVCQQYPSFFRRNIDSADYDAAVPILGGIETGRIQLQNLILERHTPASRQAILSRSIRRPSVDT